MGFLSRRKLNTMGFAHLGKDVQISDKASFHGIQRISIGDHSRIDDFSVLSAGTGGIEIGRHVHIAVMCSLIGAEEIALQDYSGLSSRVCIYSSGDDYGGDYLTNPTIPDDLKQAISLPVSIGKHCIIGAGAVLLPGSILDMGVAVGALSLVKGHLESFMIYAGCPARPVKERSRRLLELERHLEIPL